MGCAVLCCRSCGGSTVARSATARCAAVPLVHRILLHMVSHGGTVFNIHTPYTMGPCPQHRARYAMRDTLQAPPPETVAGINFSSPAFAPATDAVRPVVTCCMFPCRFASGWIWRGACCMPAAACCNGSTKHGPPAAAGLMPETARQHGVPMGTLEHLLSDNLPYPSRTRSVPIQYPQQTACTPTPSCSWSRSRGGVAAAA